MRLILALLAVVAMCGVARPAKADEIVLDAANDAPIVHIQVNGQPATMIVDPRLAGLATFSPAATARLHLFRVPMVSAQVVLDGERALRGGIARPEIRFENGERRRVMSGLFGAAPAPGVDGVIGPGALPYDVVRIRLREGPAAANAHVIALANAGDWSWSDHIGDAAVHASIDLGQEQSLAARRLTMSAVRDGLFTPRGETARARFLLGIDLQVQAMTPAPSLSLHGLPLGPLSGHTNETLYPPEQMDGEIVVTAPGPNRRPPFLFLGRGALAGCSDIVEERVARRLTVHCD